MITGMGVFFITKCGSRKSTFLIILGERRSQKQHEGGIKE